MMTQSVPYNGEVFQVTPLEYNKLENTLEDLDRYSFADTEFKTKWIIYEFLIELGHDVDKPKCPNPIPCDDLFDMSASEGAAVEVKTKLSSFQPLYSNKINKQRTKEQEQIIYRQEVEKGGEIFFGIVIVIMVIGLMILHGC